MAGRIKLSFHSRVLLTVLLLCWGLVGIFMVFQYHREKEFKAQLLDTELQMHNLRIIDAMRHSDPDGGNDDSDGGDGGIYGGGGGHGDMGEMSFL